MDYDIVVVGGGTGGCNAAAAAASNGCSVLLLERKSRRDVGDIACGDALDDWEEYPDVVNKKRIEDEAFTQRDLAGLRLEDHQGNELFIDLPEELHMSDRKRYGEILIEECDRLGVRIRHDTRVVGVSQRDATTTGIKTADGEEISCDLVIDASGALSPLQQNGDFTHTSLETVRSASHMAVAYREIIDVDEPLPWHRYLSILDPAQLAGYMWIFPRTPTRLNVGVGFQGAHKPNLQRITHELVTSRTEFTHWETINRRAAKLPTRRPVDSAVAPGFIAVGDAAGYVNPLTGKGILAAAKSGALAGEVGANAITNEDASEEILWSYNEHVMDDFGARYAGYDVFNSVFTEYAESAAPVLLFCALVYSDRYSLFGAAPDPDTFVPTLNRERWSDLYLQTAMSMQRIVAHYEKYPSAPADLPSWQRKRDRLLRDTPGAGRRYEL